MTTPVGAPSVSVALDTLIACCTALPPPRGADDRFHVVEVLLERAAAGGRQGVLGLRDAALERLLRGDVTGLLELAGVDADVAVRGLEDGLHLVERNGGRHGQGADDGQAR